MYYLLGDKGVIHIPKQKPGWIGGSAESFGFKIIHEQVGNNGTNGGIYGCTMDLTRKGK